MIALTQEQRGDLIFEVSKFLDENTFLRSTVEKQVYEIALASLTAVPVNPADCFEPVYLSPPVPEINFPDEEDCESGLKRHGLRMKSEGISQLSDGFRCGFAWHENEIKRLNGLGD